MFIASRSIYFAAGVRFDASTINWFSQLLDPPLLQNHLGESLLYLHAQPPLYNLLTGVALKIAPLAPTRVLLPVYLIASLYLCCCVHFIMVRVGVRKWLSLLMTVVIMCSPPLVLYENWYFYPHLNVAWLVGAIAWLAASGGRPGRALVVSGAHLAGLVLTRSLFHPIFFVMAALVVGACAARRERLKAFACFGGPGLLVAAWCLKNLVLFDFAGTSSWSSRNFDHATVTLLDEKLVRRARKHEGWNPAITTNWFADGNVNIAKFSLQHELTGIAALDQVFKTTPPHETNFNHFSYVETRSFYAEDARRIISKYPLQYLAALPTTTVPAFFAPVDTYWFEANRAHILRAADAFNHFEATAFARFVLAAGLILALFRTVSGRTRRDERVIFALMLLAILWVGVVGLVGEYGENYRFRYKVLWVAWIAATGGYSVLTPALGRCFRLLRRATVREAATR